MKSRPHTQQAWVGVAEATLSSDSGIEKVTSAAYGRTVVEVRPLNSLQWVLTGRSVNETEFQCIEAIIGHPAMVDLTEGSDPSPLQSYSDAEMVSHSERLTFVREMTIATYQIEVWYLDMSTVLGQLPHRQQATRSTCQHSPLQSMCGAHLNRRSPGADQEDLKPIESCQLQAEPLAEPGFSMFGPSGSAAIWNSRLTQMMSIFDERLKAAVVDAASLRRNPFDGHESPDAAAMGQDATLEVASYCPAYKRHRRMRSAVRRCPHGASTRQTRPQPCLLKKSLRQKWPDRPGQLRIGRRSINPPSEIPLPRRASADLSSYKSVCAIADQVHPARTALSPRQADTTTSIGDY